MQAAALPDLKDVFSWRDVSDVDPLTVDVSVVGVVTAGTQTLSTQTQAHTHEHIELGIVQTSAQENQCFPEETSYCGVSYRRV